MDKTPFNLLEEILKEIRKEQQNTLDALSNALTENEAVEIVRSHNERLSALCDRHSTNTPQDNT